MKKLFYILFVATLCVGLVGCEVENNKSKKDKNDDTENVDDNDNNSSSNSKEKLIVGTWELYKDYDVEYDEYYYYDDGEFVQFKSNGIGYYYEEGESKEDWFEFEWEIEGSKLYIDEEDGDWWCAIIKDLNNKELILKDDEGEYIEYYRRVK